MSNIANIHSCEFIDTLNWQLDRNRINNILALNTVIVSAHGKKNYSDRLRYMRELMTVYEQVLLGMKAWVG